MTTALLFFGYYLLLCLLLVRIPFFYRFFTPRLLIILFSLLAFASCVHTWIAYHYFPGHGDIWSYFEESTRYKQLLLHQPAAFWKSIVYPEAFNIIDTSQPALPFQYQFIQFTGALLDFLSFDNLYINNLLFCFPVFAGAVAMAKAFAIFFHSPLAACCAVGIPSTIFWTSVIYKDAILYIGLGFLLLLIAKNNWRKWMHWLLLCLCLLLIFFSRANMLAPLLPALAFLILARKFNLTPAKAAAVVVSVSIIIVVGAYEFFPGIAGRLAMRQQEFMTLRAHSALYLPVLDTSTGSLFRLLPFAIFNGLFRPLPGEGGNALYTAFSLELLLVWVLVLLALIKGFQSLEKQARTMAVFLWLIAIPGMVLIGAFVPFAGAIVRYRSVFLPLLLAPAFAMLGVSSNRWLNTVNGWLQKQNGKS